MEFPEYIAQKKEFYNSLLEYINLDSDSEQELEVLIDLLEQRDIFSNHSELSDLFILLSKIIDNHHRNYTFFDNIMQIYIYLFKTKHCSFPNAELFKIYESNRPILSRLFENQILVPDEIIIKKLQSKKVQEKFNYCHFLYSSIKPFIKEELKDQLLKEITALYDGSIEDFEEKCKIGENDSYICTLIREDSIETFVTFVTKTNFSLASIIRPSIFETNQFLIENEATLIEYATFFGSIQIFQYLSYNKVKLTQSLWIYAIHSMNSELIHFLEEKEVIPKDKIYEDCLKESIKCHHNDIASYIRDYLLKKANGRDETDYELNKIFNSCVTKSCNYFFYPDDITDLISGVRFSHDFRFRIRFVLLSLHTLTIPSSVDTIGPEAFMNCIALVKVTIPSSVTLIERLAFMGCSSLSEVSISDSVTKIGEKAFKRCVSLVHIEIPSSVTEICDKAFKACSKLAQITVNSSSIKFGDEVFNGIESIEILGNLSIIFSNFFKGNDSLQKVDFPSSVTSFGDSCFSKCSSLEKFTIPSSIAEIGCGAFQHCSSLSEVINNSSIKSISKNLFDNCQSLQKVTIPSSVILIDDYAFYACISLKEISIPPSVVSIGSFAFAYSALEEIELPDSVVEIGVETFFGCSELKQIKVSSSLKKIGEYAFKGCISLKEISIPPSVVEIGKNVFDSCSSLELISIPSSLIVVTKVNSKVKVKFI